MEAQRPLTVCRSDLVARQTSLQVAAKQGAKRLSFYGLFTEAPIPRGGFICFYQGARMAAPDKGNHYVVTTYDEYEDVRITPPLSVQFHLQLAAGQAASLRSVRAAVARAYVPAVFETVEAAADATAVAVSAGTRLTVTTVMPNSAAVARARKLVPKKAADAQALLGVAVEAVALRPGPVDPTLYPGAMVNEPLNALDGTPVEANACFVEWPDAKDVHEFLRGKVLCIAIHATRDIDAGEEIFVHYGRDYDRRGYGSALDRLGHATTVSKKVIRAAKERPTDYLVRHSLLPPADAFLAYY